MSHANSHLMFSKFLFRIVLFSLLAGSAFAALNIGGFPLFLIQKDVNVTITPATPTANDLVEIKVQYISAVHDYFIKIYVNGVYVQGCETRQCIANVGPFSNDFAYHVEYKDSGGSTESTPVTLVDVATIQAPDDTDGDGIWDINDNCKVTPNNNQADDDQDGVGNVCDNCRNMKNANQYDSDIELVCDPSSSDPYSDAVTPCVFKSDGFGDVCDNCPNKYNPDQNDTDGDGVGDACDNCVNKANSNQKDADYDDIGDVCDNCKVYPNPDQNDTDFRTVCPGSQKDGTPGSQACYKEYDGYGDACDICPTKFNPSQLDSDSDGIGDECDNCKTAKNSDQNDIDNDGIGDNCDCDDNLKGTQEDGADCGGICGGTCSACVPYLYNGDPSGKIDIVFVPDEDYNGNMTRFYDDVKDIIYDGYFSNSDYKNNQCKFNFWVYPHEGEYREVCEAWDLPSGYDTDCAFADSAAIVFQSSKRACSGGGLFSTPAYSPKVVVHETGHKIFGMADEYCCDGGYWQPSDPYPNIYETKASCQAKSAIPNSCYNYCPEQKCWPGNAVTIATCKNLFNSKGWDPNLCDCEAYATANGLDKNKCKTTSPSACPSIFVNYWADKSVPSNQLTVISPNWCNWRGYGVKPCCVNGGDGLWKADSNTCTMKSGDDFQPDCSNRAGSIFNTLPFCATFNPTMLEPFKKVVIVKFEIDISGVLTKKNVTIAYNQPPNRFLDIGALRIVGKTDSGNETGGFLMNNPLDYDLPNHTDFEPGRMMGNKTEFTAVLPLEPDMTIVEVVNTTDNKTLNIVNITQELEAFCQNNSDPDCSNFIGVNATDEMDLSDAYDPQYDWGNNCISNSLFILPVILGALFFWRKNE